MARFKDSFYLKRQRTILLLACAIDYLDGKMTKEQCEKKQSRIWQAWKNDLAKDAAWTNDAYK